MELTSEREDIALLVLVCQISMERTRSLSIGHWYPGAGLSWTHDEANSAKVENCKLDSVSSFKKALQMPG